MFGIWECKKCKFTEQQGVNQIPILKAAVSTYSYIQCIKLLLN
jgi:ribosomal protein L37AE/L43A